MSSITHLEVQHLVKQIPEDRLPDAFRLLSALATNGTRAASPTEFMRLPVNERRRLMDQQAREIAGHYEQTADERSEWQSGDFHDE